VTGVATHSSGWLRYVHISTACRLICAVVLSHALTATALAQPGSGHSYRSSTSPPPSATAPSGHAYPPEQSRAAALTVGPTLDPEVAADPLLWWEPDLTAPILRDRQTIPMALPDALHLAMSQAPELQILQSDWLIQQLEVQRQDAAFDWTSFVDGIWNRDSTPVGSVLDGAANRLRERTLTSSTGIRRLTRSGTEFALSQDFGLRSSNSTFINPNHQATSRLALELRQPLLRGAGEAYNNSGVALAQIEQESAYDRLQAGIQDHLLEVATAYWALVLRRGRFTQAVSAWSRARNIVQQMQERVSVDVTPVMLDRGQSEAATRLAATIEAEHDVIQAQDALLRLIYGSRFTEFSDAELLTLSRPLRQSETLRPDEHVANALQNRSEIHRAIRSIKASSVRMNVARNEIQPVLDMILTGYAAGLHGNNDVGTSFRNQFKQGEPGVGIGFTFEAPYQSREARAAAEQAHIAIHRMQSEFEATIGLVAEDVRNQVTQRNKYAMILPQHREALEHASRILTNTETRQHYLADGVNVADLYLENLLQMQARLAAAEYTFLQSQIQFSLADIALSRAVGQLPSTKITTDARTWPSLP
jgi:outer membrane protein